MLYLLPLRLAIPVTLLQTVQHRRQRQFAIARQGNLQLGNGWSQYIGPSNPWDRPGWPQVPQVGPMPTVFTWSNVNGTGGTNIFFPGFGAHIV